VINMSKLGIYFVEGGFSTSREGRYFGTILLRLVPYMTSQHQSMRREESLTSVDV
jgi:hypothetical protein